MMQLADIVQARSAKDKDYGVVLLPEGLIEFVPEVGALIRNINEVLAEGEFAEEKLSDANREVYHSLPEAIRGELLAERDSHGNVQVAKIATEKLLIQMAFRLQVGCKYRHILIVPTITVLSECKE